MGNDNMLKALKQCVNGRGFCGGCPMSSEPGCRQQLLECALKIINCQRAEIERLEAENKEQDQAIINALHRMGQIRAEAIKEFAERLCDGKVSNDPVVIAVKCAVKERTENTK